MATGYFDTLFNEPKAPAPFARPDTSGYSRTGKAQAEYLDEIERAQSAYGSNPGFGAMLAGHLPTLRGIADREKAEMAGLVGPRHLERTPAQQLKALTTGLGVIGGGMALGGALAGGGGSVLSGMGKVASGAKNIFGPEALGSVFGAGQATAPAPLTIPTADPATWDVDSFVKQASGDSVLNTLGTGEGGQGWMDSMVNPTQYAEGGAPETFPYSGAETPPYEPFENNYPGNEPMASNPYGLRQLPPTYTDPSATDIGDKPWVNYSSPGAGGISDLLSRYGKYLPALARGIGSVAGGLAGAKSGKQTQALGREQIALGAPSRARYEQMSANPGEWAKANLSGLLDNAADTLGRKWSVSEGNPAESPRAIMGTGKSLAALQWQMEQAEKELQERAGARGLEGYGPVLAGQQERSRAITGGIGGVLDTIFNPDRQADTKTNAIVALIKQFPELFLQKG